ncbi:MAG: PTS transporter subunit EIIC [Anaerococcus sp.]|nr:PTS transporter subunit EIIC [Anaerococcus sp.]
MKKLKAFMQDFGKSLLFPISLLSFMAIFLGLSAALQNPNIIKYLPFLNNNIIQNVLGLIRKIAGIPFGYLPLLFAMAIPMGMVKRDKEVSVYSSIAGYISMLIAMNYVLQIQGFTPETTDLAYLVESGMSETDAVLFNSQFTNVIGIFGYNTNVIGGIIVGLLTVLIHNRFRDTQLHQSMTFYSGKRFVPIINTLLMILVGVALAFIWPPINKLIINSGKLISDAGAFGAFLYGMLEKLINPTGLHHILNQTFRFTALGGVENIDGKSLVGSLQIFLYQLENNLPFSSEATKYLAQGKILHMVFGMPAAVFAIVKCAKPENRKRVLSYYTAGLTAVILTGITEPIEFTFIFLSPILWIMNSIFAGLAFLIPYLFEVTIGNIQGGIIDWLVFGVLQGTDTKWYIYLFMGPLFFAMYYYTYKFIITKFNVRTVGRDNNSLEDEPISDDDRQVSIDSSYREAEVIVDGLGGIDNIEDVDNCISRLRITVKDSSKIDESKINLSKPMGIIRPSEKNIQIIYGGRVTKMRSIVDDYIYLNTRK